MVATTKIELEFCDIKHQLHTPEILALLQHSHRYQHSISQTQLNKYQADHNFYVFAAKLHELSVGLIILQISELSKEAIIEHLAIIHLGHNLNLAAELIQFARKYFHLEKITSYCNKKELKIYRDLGFRIYNTKQNHTFRCIWEKSPLHDTV